MCEDSKTVSKDKRVERKMESGKILYGKGRNDECQTLKYGVRPIVKYIPKHWTVWCPFDKEDSEFVRQIGLSGRKVLYSHIDYGQDFYCYEPSEKWDCIISNPPFTSKRKIFERALELGRPVGLLMTNTWLNDSAPMRLFKDRELQLLMFDKRMLFKNNGKIEKKITFSSSYFCHGLLPRQIIIEELGK